MQKRILIAEDDQATREMLASIATMYEYEVVSVTDGVDLLTASANECFDLIITDLMMAYLNGASAIEILKMQGNTTPVIALTGASANEVHYVQDSFTKIYHKPININELFEYVESLIGK
jgi:DNA-binding response OmpR family regulator